MWKLFLRHSVQTIQTLDNKTENQYRENDKNTENVKHRVKQPRQKMKEKMSS